MIGAKALRNRGLDETMDKIFLHALKTEAIIGIFDWERQVKQTVIVDIEISADIRKAALSDSIDDTLNYKRVAKRVLAFVEESKFHLVETLAEHIAMLILEEFGIAWVRIILEQAGRHPQFARRGRGRWSGIATILRHGARMRRPQILDRRSRPLPRCRNAFFSIGRFPGAKSATWPRVRRWLCPTRAQARIARGPRAGGIDRCSRACAHTA